MGDIDITSRMTPEDYRRELQRSPAVVVTPEMVMELASAWQDEMRTHQGQYWMVVPEAQVERVRAWAPPGVHVMASEPVPLSPLEPLPEPPRDGLNRAQRRAAARRR